MDRKIKMAYLIMLSAYFENLNVNVKGAEMINKAEYVKRMVCGYGR